eukprot:TRINITY_DN314_c0_g1_i2.p1 TRINITY_DN314_c0_g1~~TRINITY_DN314_c0_g1_i2.p1  ORF type:complete len:117 (-),score=15.18 TRINITY_DN314_c0_g1_i2:99-449(-)
MRAGCRAGRFFAGSRTRSTPGYRFKSTSAPRYQQNDGKFGNFSSTFGSKNFKNCYGTSTTTVLKNTPAVSSSGQPALEASMGRPLVVGGVLQFGNLVGSADSTEEEVLFADSLGRI